MVTRISLFAMCMLNTSCTRACRLFLIGGVISSQEGWIYDKLTKHILENEATATILKNFRVRVPSLRELCLISIRETLSMTGKFEEAINLLELPNSLKQEIRTIIDVDDY